MSHTAFCDFGFFSENMSFTQDLLHVYHQGVLCVVIAALVCSHIESSDPHITLKGLDTTLSKLCMVTTSGGVLEKARQPAVVLTGSTQPVLERSSGVLFQN